MLARMWSNRSSRLSVVRMQNDAVTLEDSVVISYITKKAFTIWASRCASWYLPKRVENRGLQKSGYGCLWQLYSSLPKFRSNQDVLQEVNGKISCGTSKQWNIVEHWKEMSYQAMQTHFTLNPVFYFKPHIRGRLVSSG